MKNDEAYKVYKDAYYRGLFALVDELEAEGPVGLLLKDGLYVSQPLNLIDMEIDDYETLIRDQVRWDRFHMEVIATYLEATPTLSPFEANEQSDARLKADTASMAGKHFLELTDIDNKFPGLNDTGYNDKNIRNLSTYSNRAHHFNLLEGYRRTETCIKHRSVIYAMPAVFWLLTALIPGVIATFYSDKASQALWDKSGLYLILLMAGLIAGQLFMARLRFNKLKEARSKWLDAFHNLARNQSQKVGHISSVRNERLSTLMEAMLVRARRAKTRYMVGESTEIWIDEMDRWLRLVGFTQARIKSNRSFLRKKNWELRMIDRAVWARAQCEHHYQVLSEPNLVIPRHMSRPLLKFVAGAVMFAYLGALASIGAAKLIDENHETWKVYVWILTLLPLLASLINAYFDDKLRKEHNAMVDEVADEKLIRDMCEAITHNQPRGDIASKHTDLIAENARIMAEWLRDEERKNHR